MVTNILIRHVSIDCAFQNAKRKLTTTESPFIESTIVFIREIASTLSSCKQEKLMNKEKSDMIMEKEKFVHKFSLINTPCLPLQPHDQAMHKINIRLFHCQDICIAQYSSHH